MNHGIEKEGNWNKERASLSFIYFFKNRRVVALLHVILQLYSLSSILIRNDTIVAIIIIIVFFILFMFIIIPNIIIFYRKMMYITLPLNNNVQWRKMVTLLYSMVSL